MADPNSSGDPRAIQPGSSNLYLVTFLATLFLLLAVSCAIVLRSYILRRRYQQRLEDAMAAGLLLAPRSQGGRRKRLGTRPKMHDHWFDHGGENWHQMTPLSAQPVFVKRKYRDPKPANVDDPPTQAANTPNNNPPIRHLPVSVPSSTDYGLHHPLQTRTNQKHLLPSPHHPPHTKSVSRCSRSPSSYQCLQPIAVQIGKNALLDSNTSPHQEDEEDEEEELPEMVFGVTRVNYRPPKHNHNHGVPDPIPMVTSPPPSPLPIPPSSHVAATH